MFDMSAEMHRVTLIATVAAACFGWLALWAGERRFRWYWHAAPLGLALAALVPMGGYEPLVLFGTQAAVVIVGRVLAGLFDRGRSRRGRVAQDDWRFGLVDVLLGTVLLCTMFAIARSLPIHGTPDIVLPVWPWVLAGAGFALGTLAGAVSVGGWPRWYLRLPIAAITAAGGIALVLTGDPKQAIFPYTTSFLSQAALTAVWYACLRATRREQQIVYLSPDSLPPPTRSWTRSLLAHTVLHSLNIGLLVAMAEFYVNLLPPLVLPKPNLPSPNGVDDLVEIDKRLDWHMIPGQDPEMALDQDCARFVQDNAEALAMIRGALCKDWMLNVNYTDFSMSFDTLQRARAATRALNVTARDAWNSGRRADMVRDHLDQVHLGTVFGTGGIIVDELVSTAMIGVGLSQLANQLPYFDGPSHREIAFTLDVLDNERESLDDIWQRDQLLERVSAGWTGRLLHYAYRIERGEHGGLGGSVALTRDRCDAQLRLVMIEAALRAYHEEHGSWPDSLEKLVPEYLSQVPIDPFSDRPLVYRPQGQSYLLYSVGGNQTDDGGKRVPAFSATVGQQGDLFYDASDAID